MSRFENGKLTHSAMREIIDEGGSVLHNDAIITAHENLPLPEQLAENAEEKIAVAKTIDEQIAELQARKAAIVMEAAPSPDESDAAADEQGADPRSYAELLEAAKARGFEARTPKPSRASMTEFMKEQSAP